MNSHNQVVFETIVNQIEDANSRADYSDVTTEMHRFYARNYRMQMKEALADLADITRQVDEEQSRIKHGKTADSGVVLLSSHSKT